VGVGSGGKDVGEVLRGGGGVLVVGLGDGCGGV